MVVTVDSLALIKKKREWTFKFGETETNRCKAVWTSQPKRRGRKTLTNPS